MNQGETPLDFILKNTTPAITVPNPTPVPPVTPQPVTPVITPVEPSTDPMPTFGDEKAITTSVSVAPEEIDDIDEISDDPIKENYLKLKTKAKEARQTLKETLTAKATADAELEKYRTGEIVPELLKKQEQRIEELSKFEKLHNLKASDEYQERFVNPINTNTEKLKQIFTDYNVPEDQLTEAVNHALNAPTTAHLNAFLSENFDLVGAQEVKELINNTKQLQADAKLAEAEPSRTLEHLQQESASIKAIRETQRVNKIQEVAKGSWIETLQNIRSEGKIPELIRKESDPEFNQKFVDPILTHSASEYGRLVTALAKEGLTELPKDLAKGLANMILRATAQGIAFEARDVALERLGEIESSASRVNSLFRPQVGGGVPGNRPQAVPNIDMTPKDAASILVNQVLSKR